MTTDNMFNAIACAILLVITLAIFLFAPRVRLDSFERDAEGNKVYDTVSTKWIGFFPLVIAAVWLVLACSTTVQAKQIGVVTTFGKPTESFGSGWHWKKPWDKVTEIDATIQTDEYHGRGKSGNGIEVRLSDGNTATISATIRWSVSEKNATKVYEDFRSDDPTQSLRDAVVSTQFKAATNAVFGGFDPLTITGTTGAKPNYSALADDVETIMKDKTNGLVDIDSITISLISLDGNSQKKIDEYISEVSKTRIAEQAQKTAEAQAKANQILSDSVSNDPNVLVAKCLDLIADGAFDPPAGFSCWPGGSGGVVIPSAK